ncbi:MAG: arginine--tRNA ligase [Gammaproteobacteria bacterium RIFCSPHIGHO2_02_FULL_42_13]|nr:MAG: arginine--tRNA ligase [Gammaproteobacteria bacterium RIFCSPHIGHO2_02_FULL_42_13]OGT71135.1 MAG: arginine--tRNA ligase [Gammaproteobacteria bacterium RIFCSPLOWO2_02_FULL_42_9]
MKETLQQLLQQAVLQLQVDGRLPAEVPTVFRIDRTKEAKHGDYSSNVALMLAKSAQLPPLELATLLVDALSRAKEIEKIEIAGPGFINFFVKQNVEQSVIAKVLEDGEKFGLSNAGHKQRVIVEFVSANPTGPLHVGHGRGAAYGSAISDLLQAVGFDVHREYYVNDAGRQMDILATSIWLRYLEILGAKFIFPVNGYCGDYIVAIAQALKDQYQDKFKHPSAKVFEHIPADEPQGGDKDEHIDALIIRAKELLKQGYQTIHQRGTDTILADIKDDLHEFSVDFDEWFSEKQLLESGAIQKGIDALRERGHVFEKDGAQWFRATKFGDEQDRVLMRSNGAHTYFASDVAYHWHKLERGFDRLIDIFGADHHGYVPRIRAAVGALGLKKEALQIPLVQFAVLWRNGKKVPMSTRSGLFVTLRELREEVGNDAARFFYVMRACDQHMDFDLDLAKSKSNENPVYYIQYAYARICSVFRQLDERHMTFDQVAGISALDCLTSPYEKALISYISQYAETLLKSAQDLAPHQLANYLRELANRFHVYYNAEKFIIDDDALRHARLSVVMATKQILQNGLTLLKISTPEVM